MSAAAHWILDAIAVLAAVLAGISAVTARAGARRALTGADRAASSAAAAAQACTHARAAEDRAARAAQSLQLPQLPVFGSDDEREQLEEAFRRSAGGRFYPIGEPIEIRPGEHVDPAVIKAAADRWEQLRRAAPAPSADPDPIRFDRWRGDVRAELHDLTKDTTDDQHN